MKKKEVKQKKNEPAKKSVRKKVNYMAHMGGMPEYNQPELAAFKVLTVNVQNAEALHRLAKLIGQPITDKTRYFWYPALENEAALNKRWSNENEEKTKKKK